MAAITVNNATVGVRVAFSQMNNVIPYKAGAAITSGEPVCVDLGATDGTVVPINLADTDFIKPVGIAVGDAASGAMVGVALPGTILWGYALNPVTTATHRVGQPVYTATDGLADNQATNSVRVGIIQRVQNGQNGILVDIGEIYGA